MATPRVDVRRMAAQASARVREEQMRAKANPAAARGRPATPAPVAKAPTLAGAAAQPAPAPVAVPAAQSVAGLARLGYAIVPAAVAITLAYPLWLAASSLIFKSMPLTQTMVVASFFLVPALLLVASACVRIAPPKGIKLAPADAPDLFTLVEEVRAEVKALPIDAIYLTGELATELVHRPRYGLFGGTNNELVIGLPLLQVLSNEEVGALLAQELGRISTIDGPAGAFVMQRRHVWRQLLERFRARSVAGDVLLRILTGSYAARLVARSEPVARDCAAKANKMAGEIVGNATAAIALQRVCIAKAFLEEYWRRIGEEPVTTPEPSIRPYREMQSFLPRIADWEQASDTLRAALAAPAPAPDRLSLKEQLDGLAVAPSLPGPVELSAAALLGSAMESALDHFDRGWAEQVAPEWRTAFATLSPEQVRLTDLDARAAAGPLDLADALDRARIAYCLEGLDSARNRYADCIEWHENDGRAWLAAGMAFVDGGCADGVTCVEQALRAAPQTDWSREHGADWFELGHALLEAGEELGIACLEQATLIEPERLDMAAHLVDAFEDARAAAKDEDDAVDPIAATA